MGSKLNTILDIDMLIENEDKFKRFVDVQCEDSGAALDDLKAVIARLYERWQNNIQHPYARVLDSYK